MHIDYNHFQTAPMWSARNMEDLVLRAGKSVYLTLVNPLPFVAVLAEREGSEFVPPFVYPFSSVAYDDPEVHGVESVISPVSIISVELANFQSRPEMARMMGIDVDGSDGPILGNPVLGAFVGDQRYNLGPYEGPDDFEGMFNYVQQFHQEKMEDGTEFEILGSMQDVFGGWLEELERSGK